MPPARTRRDAHRTPRRGGNRIRFPPRRRVPGPAPRVATFVAASRHVRRSASRRRSVGVRTVSFDTDKGADSRDGGRPPRTRRAPSTGAQRQERSVAMRSSSCSMLAMAVGGPPQAWRSSLWIIPCGFFVRWLYRATRVFSSLRSPLSCSRTVSWVRSAGGRRGGGRRSGSLRPGQPLLLPRAEQGAHLVGLQQAGQPDEVLLVRAERGAVVDQLVQLGVGVQGGERLLVLPRLVLLPVRRRQLLVVPLLGGPVRLAQHVVALCLQLAGQPQQHRDARQEHRRHLPRPPRPHEAADRLGEEQRCRRAGGVHPHGEPRDVHALRHHADRDHPPVVGLAERARSGPTHPPRRRARRRAGCRDVAQDLRVGPRRGLVRGDDQAAGVVHTAVAVPGQPPVRGGEHGGDPLTAGVQRGPPGPRRLFGRQRLAEPCGHLLPALVRQLDVPEYARKTTGRTTPSASASEYP